MKFWKSPADGDATIRFLEPKPRIDRFWITVPRVEAEARETLDTFVKRHGFRDEAEFHRMVASVDMTKPPAEAAFRLWQNHDGSRAGLQYLLDTYGSRTW